MRTVLLATSNPHKLDEVRQILAPTEMTVLGLDSLGIELDEPVEDGGTFAENARIKALYYARHTGRMCLADDSGLACDGLGGAPGIHSARYSGVNSKSPSRTAGRPKYSWHSSSSRHL